LNADLIGRTLAHYRITAAIGAGGMGQVYRATDTMLEREVALKALPGDMAGDPEFLARFKREARAVAALNHPHIVTIYSVEEAEGVHFLTMELVEGQPLKKMIPEHGLPLDRILDIGAALADALAAAHEKGIVHRDLKPANIMITKTGHPKVLDFGLAKATSATTSRDDTMTSAGYTKTGAVMGTPAYMAPEQLTGGTIDPRTDIFSLGIVLYEMTAGRRPFEQGSSAELASAILRDLPRPLGELRTDVPELLGRIILRCLEKRAADRFSSAREFRHALQSVTAEGAQVWRTLATDSGANRAEEGFWVAVLPFEDGGTDADLTALADGLTEDIVTGLSRFSYLRVIARSSTSKHARRATDVRAIGKELGARYVIEGNLRRVGSKLRIGSHLVDATSGAHLWAETYDRTFQREEIFVLQDDVVARIVSTVADTYGVLPRNMGEILRSRAVEELTPYEAVLRSFAHFPRLSAEEHAAATVTLERAMQKAPGYADGWAMLSMLAREEHAHGFNLRPDPIGRALTAARRAVEIAPSNHLAYHALASAQFFHREIPAFRNSAERALALNPLDGFTVAYMGFLLAYAGEWERGCALVRYARQLNPHHPGWYWFPDVFAAYRKKDYRGAADSLLKVNMPGFWRTNFAFAVVYGQLGERDAAAKAVRDLLAIRPTFPETARADLGKWWDAELVEHLIEGLRKAGMEVALMKQREEANDA
jgi:serine/threonine protein kinase/tetratricopeptide (TPR) repeat protein